MTAIDRDVLIVRVPLRLRQRGGRTLVVVLGAADPSGAEARGNPAGPRRKTKAGTRTPILRALGRAWRWKRLIESGAYGCITDLAAAEKVNHSYIRRLLRLTLLSPKITEIIVAGRQPRQLQLEYLLRRTPRGWERQANEFV